MTELWKDECEAHDVEIKYRDGDPVVTLQTDTLDDLVVWEADKARSAGEFLIKCADKIERKIPSLGTQAMGDHGTP